MNDISAVLVVKGNPIHLAESLKSINDLVSEVIIVDIGLDKEAHEIIKKFQKAKIITENKPVKYVEIIREKTKSYAKNDYILFLDPDEVIPPALNKKITDEYRNYDFISIPRKNIILGSWIQHARWWPDYQIRLFKKGNVTWPDRLHAAPETKGNGLLIETTEDLAILHYNYESVTEYLEKMQRYAQSQSDTMIKNNIEYPLDKAMDESLTEFISRFYFDKGYKDNMHGFSLAFLQMIYPFLVHLYNWEKKGYTPVKEEELIRLAEEFFKKGYKETLYWQSKQNLIGSKQKTKNKIFSKALSLLDKV